MRENRLFAYAKTKTQISFAVTAKLIRAFVFATQIVQSFYFLNRNFKPLAIFCGCTARFVWDLVGNPEDRFSHNVLIRGRTNGHVSVNDFIFKTIISYYHVLLQNNEVYINLSFKHCRIHSVIHVSCVCR